MLYAEGDETVSLLIADDLYNVDPGLFISPHLTKIVLYGRYYVLFFFFCNGFYGTAETGNVSGAFSEFDLREYNIFFILGYYVNFSVWGCVVAADDGIAV